MGMARLVEVVQRYSYIAEYKTPEILVMSPPPLCQTADEWFNDLWGHAIAKSKLFERHYARVAKDMNVHFFDAGSAAKTDPTDGGHLDAAQHPRHRRGAGSGGEEDFGDDLGERFMAEQFDVVIIGAGPGGYVTAIRAAQLGFKTAIVEREHLGGICLNWGCIPTKALLRSAEIYHYMKHAKNYGLSADNIGFDAAGREAFARRFGPSQWWRRHAAEEKQGHGDLGRGKITKPGEVVVSKAAKPAMQPQHPEPKGAVGAGTYAARHIIIATGARPRALPGLEPDGKLVWTYFEAMVPPAMPKSLLVVGSGAIGIEFASFYNSMGVDVTVVEIVDQIMPVEDTEIARIAQKQLEKQGLKIKTGAKVGKAEEECRQRDGHHRAAAASPNLQWIASFPRWAFRATLKISDLRPWA